MDIIDTHCHIHGSQQASGDGGEAVTRALWRKAGFPTGDDIIARAAENGVTKMICVGCSLSDSQLAVDFVQGRPQCWASIGIHPHEASGYMIDGRPDDIQLRQFADLTGSNKVVAIGECGLDYFYAHSEPADQAIILRFQIELALQHNLPMIFHVRQAFADFWPIFESYSTAGTTPIRGVLHSFTDNQDNLRRAIEHGLCIGVNGIATFAKSQEQLDMYQSIPSSKLVLETDSPFLTPAPYRGTICEPYHTRVTATFLADLRHENLDALAAGTTANARRLFGF